MIIPINVSKSGPSLSNYTFPPQLAQFGSNEVVLIELQGSLEVDGDKEGQVVGKLRVDDVTKKSTLLIGYHLLEGKLVNLPKPLAVLHRHQADKDDDTMANEEDAMNEDDKARPPRAQAGWDVVAVVKRKMVFSKRPMPMVGRVEPP